jgi:hypothetical protein
MAVPTERKLDWLAEALEFTRAMLPRERRREWLAMRGERPGASIPIDVLQAAWPPFVVALDSGIDSLLGFMSLLSAQGHSQADVHEILLALNEWAPYRQHPRPADSALVAAALAQRPR